MRRVTLFLSVMVLAALAARTASAQTTYYWEYIDTSTIRKVPQGRTPPTPPLRRRAVSGSIQAARQA